MTRALLEVAEAIVSRAEPGEQVEAYVSRGSHTSVQVYEGDVESLTRAETAGVGVRVVRDGRPGFAWVGSLADDLVAEALVTARDNAAHAEPDPHGALGAPDGVPPPELDLVAEPVDREVDRVELALALERETIARHPSVRRVRTARVTDAQGESAIASTEGVRAHTARTLAHASVLAMAEDGDDVRTGGGITIGRSLADLSVDEAADDAVDRATELLGASKPATRTVSLVLEPRMTATLLGIVGGMLNGERVLKGRSPFADRIGEPIAAPLLGFVDDPTDPRSLSAATHDGEGLACRRNVLIRDGVLERFLHRVASARRAGTDSTASAVRSYRSTPSVGLRALAVEPGTGTHDDLVAGVDDGVVVRSLKGLHSGVNPVSGDLSVGIEGIAVRGGAVAEPIAEATIAGSIQRMLLDVVAVGDDLEWTPGGSGGVTLVVEGVRLSGA